MLIRKVQTVKRLFDIVASLLALLVLSPGLGIIALALRLEKPGPILYRATRVGKDGRTFVMFKFRTMVDGPASDAGPRVTARDDPRITRLGAFLRRTKLNELPQLWNVLRGDMSLVGPRPEDPEFVAHYTAEEREVLSVRPGITSPAAVLYRNEEELLRYASATESYLGEIMPTKLRLDLLYVRRRSFLLDLDVLLSTVLALLPGVGRAAPEAAGIFVGPVQRLVRQRVPWFALDWLTALIAIAAAGLIWRAAWPLDLGWERALVGALAMALAFSLTNRLLRVQHTAWRYASSQEVIDLALSTALSTGLIVGADRLLMTQPHLPLGMLLLTGLLALVGFIAARYRHRLLSGLACRLRPTLGLARERVLVVGGGEAGQLMVWLLQNGAGARALQVVGIVDDDLWKRGERIHRVRVLGDRTAIPALVQAYDVGLIVFAIHHIAPSEREAILDLCRSTPARVVLVPDVVGLLTQLARSAAHPESRFEKGSVGERSDGNGRGMPPGQLPDVGRIAGSHCDGRPILAPPIHLGEASGLAVDAATVAHWLDDVERLLAQGRTADAEQRLAEIRASLLVTE